MVVEDAAATARDVVVRYATDHGWLCGEHEDSHVQDKVGAFYCSDNVVL